MPRLETLINPGASHVFMINSCGLRPYFWSELSPAFAPDEPSSSAATHAETPVEVVPGYSHSLNSSRFNPGPALTQVSESGFSKLVGSQGVFAIFAHTGWAVGVPNGDAPATKLPPLTTSGPVHNKRVLDYFVTSGLPTEQVARVNAHATVSQSGFASELLDPPRAPTLDWYSSVLSRSIQGLDVPDSFAFARFNIDDEVVFESIYWPAIPAAVVSEAVAFRQRLTSPANAAAFRSKLPSDLGDRPGTITIRHTRMTYTGTFVAKISYDVLTPRTMSRVRHFDSTATEFELPDTPSVAPQTSKTSKP